MHPFCPSGWFSRNWPFQATFLNRLLFEHLVPDTVDAMKYLGLEPYLVSRIRSQKTKFVPYLHIVLAASRESKPSESHLKPPKTPKSGILIYELLNRYADNGAGPHNLVQNFWTPEWTVQFILPDWLCSHRQTGRKTARTNYSFSQKTNSEYRMEMLHFALRWGLIIICLILINKHRYTHVLISHMPNKMPITKW